MWWMATSKLWATATWARFLPPGCPALPAGGAPRRSTAGPDTNAGSSRSSARHTARTTTWSGRIAAVAYVRQPVVAILCPFRQERSRGETDRVQQPGDPLRGGSLSPGGEDANILLTRHMSLG